MARLLTVFLLLLPIASQAQQIYQTTDEQGNVIFTDQPPADSSEVQRVELNRTNTAKPTPARPPAQQSAADAEPEPTAYEVTIVDPPNETTIAMGPGNFSVTAEVSPSPGRGDTLQLKLDGENRGDPQLSGSWQLTNVYRGAHDVTVSVVNAKGKTLETSAPVRVYVLRPSSNFRN